MDIDFLKAELVKFNPSFTQEELDLGLPFFEKKTYTAKDEILKHGDVCKYLFIAESSVTRCYYYDHGGKEQTLWMKPERPSSRSIRVLCTRMPPNLVCSFMRIPRYIGFHATN